MIIGAGGHARSVASVASAIKGMRIAALVDLYGATEPTRFGYPLLPGIDALPSSSPTQPPIGYIVALGDNAQRQRMTEHLIQTRPQLVLTTLVHPGAVVGDHVTIGAGSVVMPGAVIGAGATIGRGCVLNTQSSIDHDGVMGDWASLAPGVVTGGHVTIGNGAFIGLGSKVLHNIAIGQSTVVGAGALVTRNLPDLVVAFGAPCRVVRPRKAEDSYL